MIGRLQDLWTAGHSCAEIGRRIGVPRNAIVGKAHRIGLVPRLSPIRPAGSGQPRSPATKVTLIPTASELSELPAEIISRRAQLLPRMFSAGAARTCQWIDGPVAGADTQFCGVKSILGCSWCAEHRALVFSRTFARTE